MIQRHSAQSARRMIRPVRAHMRRVEINLALGDNLALRISALDARRELFFILARH